MSATAVRQAREAIASGDKDKAQAAVKTATKKLDKAVSKGCYTRTRQPTASLPSQKRQVASNELSQSVRESI